MKIKKIFFENIEGKFSENNGMVKIEWADGDVLTMQSELFYSDWMERVKKKVRVEK